MAQPRFRFVDVVPVAVADAEFWRDAEASDRLGSRFKSNLFLRELCRAKAQDHARHGHPPHLCAEIEQTLLEAVAARGYRVFGPDLAVRAEVRLADAG